VVTIAQFWLISVEVFDQHDAGLLDFVFNNNDSARQAHPKKKICSRLMGNLEFNVCLWISPTLLSEVAWFGRHKGRLSMRTGLRITTSACLHREYIPALPAASTHDG
jgi:hypothetical protein